MAPESNSSHENFFMVVINKLISPQKRLIIQLEARGERKAQEKLI